MKAHQQVRFIASPEVYYSLNDIVAWLCNEQVLTSKQGRRFFHCVCQYTNLELAEAYRTNTVFEHLIPIILPTRDYFIHWIVWANLLMLLPDATGRHFKVHELNVLLDEPDSIPNYPELFLNIDPVLVDDEGHQLSDREQFGLV